MQTESAEKHTEFQTNFNPFCAALVFINFPVHFCLPAVSLEKANTRLANVAGPSPS